jgi:hypothetical protein
MLFSYDSHGTEFATRVVKVIVLIQHHCHGGISKKILLDVLMDGSILTLPFHFLGEKQIQMDT